MARMWWCSGGVKSVAGPGTPASDGTGGCARRSVLWWVLWWVIRNHVGWGRALLGACWLRHVVYPIAISAAVYARGRCSRRAHCAAFEWLRCGGVVGVWGGVENVVKF